MTIMETTQPIHEPIAILNELIFGFIFWWCSTLPPRRSAERIDVLRCLVVWGADDFLSPSSARIWLESNGEVKTRMPALGAPVEFENQICQLPIPMASTVHQSQAGTQPRISGIRVGMRAESSPSLSTTYRIGSMLDVLPRGPV